MSIDKGCGRMEEVANVAKVLRELADLYEKGNGFVISGDNLVKAMKAKKKACKCGKTGANQEACIKAGGHYTFVPGLVVSFIPSAKHHNGKPMILIGNHNDISTTCLEISEEGLFAYYVDDGVS